MAQEDALVEQPGLKARVGVQDDVDLLDGTVDIAAVEERYGPIGAHVGIAGLLGPGGLVDFGGRGEIRRALLVRDPVGHLGGALVVQAVGSRHQLAVTAARVGVDGRRGTAALRAGVGRRAVVIGAAGHHHHDHDRHDGDPAEEPPDQRRRDAPLGGRGRRAACLGLSAALAALAAALLAGGLTAQGALDTGQIGAALGAELGVGGVVATLGTIHSRASSASSLLSWAEAEGADGLATARALHKRAEYSTSSGCKTLPRQDSEPPRRASPRCAAAGCTWRRGRCARGHRS